MRSLLDGRDGHSQWKHGSTLSVVRINVKSTFDGCRWVLTGDGAKEDDGSVSHSPRTIHSTIHYTGALLSPPPPPPNPRKNLSTLSIRNTAPTTGTSLKLAAAIGKNCPNKYTNPYTCNTIPTIPHRIMTKTNPPKKARMPRNRSLREKKRTAGEEEDVAECEEGGVEEEEGAEEEEGDDMGRDEGMETRMGMGRCWKGAEKEETRE
ncbi:hypothetical protein HJC23_000065 [Cyclotella cryptica]|uniref:Uncharacterized protein n=1 Tax=Cyclotella cryptica TaxID=29204 RepID=A0ABD3PIK5_9STRA